MLQTFRNQTGKWFIKILLGLIIFSFGIWGIMDMVNAYFNNRPVATVGDQKISYEHFARTVELETKRIQEHLKSALTPKHLAELKIHQTVLDRMADQFAFAQILDDLGITVSNNLIKQYIKSEFSQGGQFNYDHFSKILKSNQLSEDSFLNDVRGRLRSNQVLVSVAGEAVLPDFYRQFLYRVLEEKRVFHYMIIPIESIKSIAEPSRDDLSIFYEKMKANYSQGEKRQISLILIHNKTLKDTASGDGYAKKIMELKDKIEDSLGAGQSFEDTAKALDLEYKQITINNQGEDDQAADLLSPYGEAIKKRIMEFTFASNLQDESALFEEDEFSALVRVDAIHPSKILTFDEAYSIQKTKDTIQKDWKFDKQRSEAGNLAEKAIKEIKTLSDLKKMAEKNQYTLKSTTVTRATLSDQKESGINQETWTNGFGLNPSELVIGHTPHSFILLFLSEILPFKSNPQNQKKFYEIFDRMISEDLSMSFIEWAKTRYPLTVNKKMLTYIEHHTEEEPA